MKKLFSLIVVALFAVAASADVIWNETLDKNGTYIDRGGSQAWGTNWPYANQWYDAGNFAFAYDSVKSYTCSIRSKKLNSATSNTIGFYFGASKTADKCYLRLFGKDDAIVEGAVNCKLMFDLCAAEVDGGDAGSLIVKVNGVQLPGIDLALGNQLVTSAVEWTLSDGDIKSIEIAFDNAPAQRFISNLRIEGEAGTAHGQGGVTPVTPDLPEGVILPSQAVEAAANLADPVEEKATVEGEAVKVRGYVTYAYNESNGKQSAWIGDNASTGLIQAAFLVVTEAVVKGDYVEVEGTLAKYKKPATETKPAEVIVEVINGTMSKVSQGIENVVLTEKAQKVMVDGVVYIVRDNKMFNLQGAQVR